MNRARLDEIVAAHGVKVDGMREGAGKFRDLEIGVGAPSATLNAVIGDLKGNEIGCRVHLDHVTNEGHPEFGKAFVMVHSFWNE